MKGRRKFDTSIILRFLIEQASARDVKLLEEWMYQDPNNKRYFEKVRDAWDSLEVERELDDEKIKEDFLRVLNRLDTRKAPKFHRRNYIVGFTRNLAVRSTAIFLFGVAFAWILIHYYGASFVPSASLNVVETPRGSRATVILPDGSKVSLNAESKLTYPQQFTDDQREIFLEGEAYFEVRKDLEKKFLVKTPDLTVKVFGTSFNVKSYPDENTTETTLVEGSISVYKHSTNGKIVGSEMKMQPNQRLVFYKDQENITPTISPIKKIENVPPRKAKLVLSKRIDTERFVSWKDGHLKIVSEPMKNISVTLERRYDVRIHFVDEDIKQLRFTGTFKNETIEQVLAAMKLASPIEYRILEREIWISKDLSRTK